MVVHIQFCLDYPSIDLNLACPHLNNCSLLHLISYLNYKIVLYVCLIINLLYVISKHPIHSVGYSQEASHQTSFWLRDTESLNIFQLELAKMRSNFKPCQISLQPLFCFGLSISNQPQECYKSLEKRFDLFEGNDKDFRLANLECNLDSLCQAH